MSHDDSITPQEISYPGDHAAPQIGSEVDPYARRESDGIRFLEAESPKSAVDKPENKIGLPLCAWTVIVIIVILIALRPWILPDEVHNQQNDKASGNDVVLRVMEIQGQYFVGASEMVSSQDLYKQSDPLNVGSLDQRLRYIVLTGELAGAEEAKAKLDDLDRKLADNQDAATDRQNGLRHMLGLLYADFQEEEWNAPSLDKGQREQLKAELGWYGALALAPASSPDREARKSVMQRARATMGFVLVAVLAIGSAGFLGLCGLVLFVVLALNGRLRSKVDAGSRFGGVYAETFAIWMLLFIGLSIAAGFAVPDAENASIENMLSVNLVAFFASLTALLWPLVRGVPLRRMLDEIGLSFGKFFLEPVWGVVAYLSTLPLLVGGLIIMILLMGAAGLITGGVGGGDEFATQSMPSHPIMEWIGDAGWTGRLLIVLLACVAAPIVEETMFRGVLYRHLRDSTARWRIFISVMFSGGLSSFIFAVIHPQGILAVPPLMALAFGFSIARELRGSLIAPMTMHALNNGMVTMLMFAILS